MFLNSLAIPFLWDDLPSIVSNQTIRRLWVFPGALAPPLETPMAGRPIVNLSLAINFAVGDLTVTGYHWWNIAVHVMCGVLLYAVVRRTLSSHRFGLVFQSGATGVALITALVWMVHPLETEPVDYVTQRTESMMALFLLLTLYCSIRAMQANRGSWWPVVAVIACALGMASKATMVVAPILVLLYDSAFESTPAHLSDSRRLSASFQEAIHRRRGLHIGLASCWIVLAALVWMSPRSTVGASDQATVTTYLLNQVQFIARYLRLAAWPQGFVLDYGVPQMMSLRDVWPQALILLSLLIGVVSAWARRSAPGTAGVMFFLALAPTSLIPITSEVAAERRMYVPMMALVTMVVAAAWWVLPVRSRALSVVAVALSMALVGGLGATTMARNALYQDPVALWRDSLEHSPNSRARLSLASALMVTGRGVDAIPELRLAVQDYPEAKYALGAALHASGFTDEARTVLSEFVDARASEASRIPARLLLGQILAAEGRGDAAEIQFRAILDISPNDRGAREKLGDQLLSRGRWDESLVEYDRLVRDDGGSASLEFKIGMAHKGANRFDAAVPHFVRALTLDPRQRQAHRSLAEMAWESGDDDDAVRHATAELALNPGDAETHNFLGVVLASTGRVREGADHFREALRIVPSDGRARENLARAERDLSR